MDEACYLCRRTQRDLDHLNEEVRARVYLAYFTHARGLIDEERRRITFLQRLKEDESGDPHFRIGAAQVFGDPGAYQKLMPWIDTLMEIAHGDGKGAEVRGTIGELVETLLADERRRASEMEEGLERLRGGFASGTMAPLRLQKVTRSFPVDWGSDGRPLLWRPAETDEREPLQSRPGAAARTVEMELQLCTVCQSFLVAR